ncbi:MAG: hypothetical protein IJ545_07320 [Alphaproteobacteria bacterium]|nr:hypothetical protein [Alphaproteobacteria bacterium]
MIALSKQTSGEDFLKEVSEAGTNKGALFALLYETLQTEHPKLHLSTIINQLKNFDALVNYDASVAKFQIKRNAENIAKTIDEIKNIKVLGKDNFKYKDMMIRKLNILASIKPDAKSLADIIAAEYIARGYGNIGSFKCEFMHYVHSLHSVSTLTEDDSCVLRC